jgi:branched-chain amino acid transport system ATP-binding protein
MSDTILNVSRLTVRFGGLTAVNEVDFSISPKEIVSLIGPNGAGKTTTFNAVTGFIRKASGTVSFEGQDLTGRKAHEIARAGIVRTYQITSLFPSLMVLDNIRTGHHMEERETLLGVFFNTCRKRKIEKETLEKAHEILGFIGLEGKKDTIASHLPYGEQRLLEIGIALAAGPKLLLLDEPSAGLNDTETQEMKHLIGRMRDRGITILLVEHDMKLVMGVSDRIVVLNFGKKIAEGTPDQIRCNPEVITAYLGERKRNVKS